MSEHYEVPIELVRIYVRLERSFTSLITYGNLKTPLTEVGRILEDIRDYRNLIGNNSYIFKDMMDVKELGRLETLCRNLLSIAQDRLNEVAA